MSASGMPAMPAFSYAQAAKGLGPIKDKDQSTEHQQPSKIESKPEPPSSQPSSRSSRSRARVEEKESDSTSKEVATPPSTIEDATDKENVPLRRASQQKSEATPTSAASPNLTGAIGSPKEKEVAQRLDRTDSWEKASLASASGDKETASGTKEKAKESEDDWDKVSVPSIGGEKDKELKPAPPPPVNFWTARQQARDLEKQRAPPSTQPAPSALITSSTAVTARPKSFVEGSRSKPGPRDSVEKEVGPTTRRSNEAIRSSERTEVTSSQTSRPQSQHGDKGDAPAVGDSSSWPTPVNATVDDRRKPTPQENKSEGRTNGSKSHGKQWVTMPFVPTAKFETQLPASAARRGARSARGRGDGLPRGGHSTAGNPSDRQEASNVMPPPPIPRQAGEQDRGRKSDSGRGGRSSSLPTSNRRPTSRESTRTNTRKPSGQRRDNIAVPDPAQSFAPPDTDPVSTQRISNFDMHTPSRSSSRHGGNATLTNGDLTSSQLVTEPVADPFTISNNEAGFRTPYLPDRGKPTHPTYRATGDPTRERGPPRNREWSWEKSDTAREKVESWRDREYSGESSYRREPRPERGRGGYRGRGNHSSSYQNSHAYTAPLPQNGFENPKASNATEGRSRQSSQQFGVSSQTSSNRNNPRSQSIPVGMMYPGYYNNIPGVPGVPGVPGTLSPLQTDMSTFGYPPQMPMQPGIMSALPYNDSLNSYAVLSMVMTQVEYYFSIDNLCKDLFLRKNMDSQGWVPLNVIANFKRIKTLTEDAMSMDTLRFVCQQVKSVEYLHGEDGEDRLRRRDGWQDFVLDKHERFRAAQNDGPRIQPHPQQMPMMPPMIPSDGMPFVPQQVRSPSSAVPALNGGYNAQAPAPYGQVPSLDGLNSDAPFQLPFPHSSQDQSRGESTTSPLSQAETAVRQPISFNPDPRSTPGAANGHRRHGSRSFNEENVFPDEAIASINICVREPLPDLGTDKSTPVPGIARVTPNESSNADVPAVSIPPRVSGLRGGAASPEQLAHLQSMKFGFSSSQTAAGDAPAFYTKEGEQTQMPAMKPGQYFVSYNALHDSSLHQREQGVEGAMISMYSFWANFLVDKFNEGMYNEFKTLAEADAQEGDTVGIQHLMNYYHGALKTSAALSDRVASDLVTSLREETDPNRPVFKMMRMAWRNGALNLKTRKRVGDLLRKEEKAEFDKGG